MSLERYYEDLRKLQKRANQRMVRLEKEGIKTPAYQAVQAKLEMIGQRKGRAPGRRFKESGKATYNEYEIQKKILEDFLGAKTSTVKQAKDYQSFIYDKSNQLFNLEEIGITKKDWLQFWENMPAKKDDRLLSSDRVITILKAFTFKKGEKTNKGLSKRDFKKIVKAVQATDKFKVAYTRLGLTYNDIKAVKSL